jgi:hypothetical protein
MGLESATYISQLNAANPVSSDDRSQGDDHFRLLKSTIQTTFPAITGAVTPTHAELNYVDGVTSAIQTQLDAKAIINGQVFSADIAVSRTATPTIGAYLFGNTGTKYLTYDGTNYALVGGRLLVSSGATAEAAGVDSTTNTYFSWYRSSVRKSYIQSSTAGFLIVQEENLPITFSTNSTTAATMAAGGNFTSVGLLKGNNGGAGLGAITVSTSAPSGGAAGDLWMRY